MVLAFGPLLERRSFVRLAAREAARHYVVNDGSSPAPLVEAMAATYRIDGVRLGLCGADPVTVRDGWNGADACPPLEDVADLVAGGGVTATVEADVPLFTLPWEDTAVGGMTIGASHTEYVDLYRSFP